MKVISYGQKKVRKTAQVVFIQNGKSTTKHLWHLWGDTWVDKDAKKYTL